MDYKRTEGEKLEQLYLFTSVLGHHQVLSQEKEVSGTDSWRIYMPPTRQLVGNKILCPACLVKEKKNTEERTEKKTRGVRPHFLRLLSTRGPLTLDPFLYSNLCSCNNRTVQNDVKIEIRLFVMNFNSSVVLFERFWLWAWRILGVGTQTCKVEGRN